MNMIVNGCKTKFIPTSISLEQNYLKKYTFIILSVTIFQLNILNHIYVFDKLPTQMFYKFWYRTVSVSKKTIKMDLWPRGMWNENFHNKTIKN